MQISFMRPLGWNRISQNLGAYSNDDQDARKGNVSQIDAGDVIKFIVSLRSAQDNIEREEDDLPHNQQFNRPQRKTKHIPQRTRTRPMNTA